MVAGMVMPIADLRAIYELLFRDGVMVTKKDKRPQCLHPELQGVANLKVIRAMGSLKSKGFVRETFAWKHAYYYLTNEGIVYLREYLRLPPEIVPSSLQRVRRPASTLDVMRRAARVQTVEGPTSYVPKPRAGGESQEATIDRQGYRHKRAGEEEGQSERPQMRFRGSYQPRAPAGEPGVQTQTFFRRGQGFRRGEERVAEEGQRRGFRNNYAPPENRAVRSSVPVREAKPPTPVAGPVVPEIPMEVPVALPVVQQAVEPALPPAFIPAVEPEAPPPSPPVQKLVVKVIEEVEEDVVELEEDEAEVVEEVAAEPPAAVEEPEPVVEAVVEEEGAAVEEKEVVVQEEEEAVVEEKEVVVQEEEEAAVEEKEVVVQEEEEAVVEEEKAVIEEEEEAVVEEDEEAAVEEEKAVVEEEEEAVVEEDEEAAVEEEEAIIEEPAVEVIPEVQVEEEPKPVLEEPVEAVEEEVIEATLAEHVEEEPKPASVVEESSSEEEEEEEEEQEEEEEDVVEEDTPAEVVSVEDAPNEVSNDAEIEVLTDDEVEASIPMTKAMTPEPDSDLDMPTPPPPIAEDFTDLTEEVERVTVTHKIDGPTMYMTSQEVVTVAAQAPETQVVSQSHTIMETSVQMVPDGFSEFGLEQEKIAAFEADFAIPVVPSDCPIAALKSSLPQGDWGFLTEDPEEEQEVKKVWPDSIEG